MQNLSVSNEATTAEVVKTVRDAEPASVLVAHTERQYSLLKLVMVKLQRSDISVELHDAYGVAVRQVVAKKKADAVDADTSTEIDSDTASAFDQAQIIGSAAAVEAEVDSQDTSAETAAGDAALSDDVLPVADSEESGEQATVDTEATADIEAAEVGGPGTGGATDEAAVDGTAVDESGVDESATLAEQSGIADTDAHAAEEADQEAAQTVATDVPADAVAASEGEDKDAVEIHPDIRAAQARAVRALEDAFKLCRASELSVVGFSDGLVAVPKAYDLTLELLSSTEAFDIDARDVYQGFEADDDDLPI